MAKSTRKSKTNKTLQIIPIFAAEKLKLEYMGTISCKADVKTNAKCFKQDNIKCFMVNRFRITPGFLTVEDPDNISVMLENLWTHEPFDIDVGDKIADLVIFAGPFDL